MLCSPFQAITGAAIAGGYIRYTRRMLVCPVRECHLALAHEQPRLGCARQGGFDAHGGDVGMHAVDAAARRYPECEWIVANVDRSVPDAIGSCATGVSVTAPTNEDGLPRVLRGNGDVRAAMPGQEGL